MQNAGTTGIVLFAIVGGVFLLCTVNLAQLLLASASLAGTPRLLFVSHWARSRVVVVRQLLIENLLLGFFGLSPDWARSGNRRAAPRLMVQEPAMLVAIGSINCFHLDWRVFLFASRLQSSQCYCLHLFR